jgi:hypothetical protein
MFGPESAVALSEDDREQDITFATMAQFPQPIGGESFQFINVGPRLKITFATDNRLLTMNKGKTREGQALGFSVCRKCGCSSVNDDETILTGKHKRPYFVRGRNVPECDGSFERVFLWFDFPTDLLLLRLTVAAPLLTDLTQLSTVKTIESAAYSIAEALRLAASRHRQLDLDPTEFGAGFRLLPAQPDGSISLDIYLYDTLAGGAGYSQLAGNYFQEIIESTLAILESCDCDTSCTDCLDHFHNQQLKKKLDRNLGASLLRYGLYGTVPMPDDLASQMDTLAGLAASLTLDGYEYDMPAGIDGQNFPMVVRKNSKRVGVALHPALLQIFDKSSHDSNILNVSETTLRKDLVGVHSKLRKLLLM